ncbi:HEPN domain-containing protein [Pyrobaculum neutrophilum]|uniref:HEPN domain-containing protein n=1 Tax=Pyrobaculum neutrophilum TaxID=70771 RepID=UPI00315A3F43
MATGEGRGRPRCAEEHYVQARYPDARVNDWEAEGAVECVETIWRYAERHNLTG